MKKMSESTLKNAKIKFKKKSLIKALGGKGGSKSGHLFLV